MRYEQATSDSEVEESRDAQPCCSFNMLEKFPKALVAMTVVTIVTGIIVLMAVEEWSLLTAVYFIAQIVTTIGYGDVVVSTDGMRVFVSFYVLWLLVILAHFLNDLITGALNKEGERVATRLREVEHKDNELEAEVKVKWEVFNKVIVTGLVFLGHVLAGTTFWGVLVEVSQRCSFSSEEGGCKRVTSEPTNVAQAFYMSVITMTTVGFGDYTPSSRIGRIFAIFWMCTGVISTGFFISAIQSLIFESQESKKYGLHETVNEAVFRELDTSGDGLLSLGEFRAYVLVKHDIVPKDVIDIIDKKFNDIVQELRAEDPGSVPKRKVSFEQIMKWQAKHKKGQG